MKSKDLSPEKKKTLARACWGFVDPPSPPLTNYLDDHFRLREEEFFTGLKKLCRNWKYVELVKEGTENEELVKGIESSLHYMLKVFIVRYLIEKLKVSPEKIETKKVLKEELCRTFM